MLIENLKLEAEILKDKDYDEIKQAKYNIERWGPGEDERSLASPTDGILKVNMEEHIEDSDR